MFGAMIDDSLKFYAVPFTPSIHDFKDKVTVLELLC